MIGKIIGFCFGVAIAVFRLPTLTLLRQPENRVGRSDWFSGVSKIEGVRCHACFVFQAALCDGGSLKTMLRA